MAGAPQRPAREEHWGTPKETGKGRHHQAGCTGGGTGDHAGQGSCVQGCPEPERRLEAALPLPNGRAPRGHGERPRGFELSQARSSSTQGARASHEGPGTSVNCPQPPGDRGDPRVSPTGERGRQQGRAGATAPGQPTTMGHTFRGCIGTRVRWACGGVKVTGPLAWWPCPCHIRHGTGWTSPAVGVCSHSDPSAAQESEGRRRAASTLVWPGPHLSPWEPGAQRKETGPAQPTAAAPWDGNGPCSGALAKSPRCPGSVFSFPRRRPSQDGRLHVNESSFTVLLTGRLWRRGRAACGLRPRPPPSSVHSCAAVRLALESVPQAEVIEGRRQRRVWTHLPAGGWWPLRHRLFGGRLRAAGRPRPRQSRWLPSRGPAPALGSVPRGCVSPLCQHTRSSV